MLEIGNIIKKLINKDMDLQSYYVSCLNDGNVGFQLGSFMYRKDDPSIKCVKFDNLCYCLAALKIASVRDAFYREKWCKC